VRQLNDCTPSFLLIAAAATAAAINTVLYPLYILLLTMYSAYVYFTNV